MEHPWNIGAKESSYHAGHVTARIPRPSFAPGVAADRQQTPSRCRFFPVECDPPWRVVRHAIDKRVRVKALPHALVAARSDVPAKIR